MTDSPQADSAPTDEPGADLVRQMARVAGVPVPEEDLDLLTRAFVRYLEVAAPLQSADLEGIEPPRTSDPRAGW